MIVRRIFAATTAVVTVAGIVTACSGVPDIVFGDGTEVEGGTSLPDGGGQVDTGGPQVDAAGDVGADAPQDAPTDAITCTPTNGGVEDCDDGVDNDCNGKVDCADTACDPTHACIATPPVGWALVAESDNTRPTCPPEYANARDVEVVPGIGTGTCSCSCALVDANEACNLQQSSVQITSNNNTCAIDNHATGSPQVVAANAVACTALTTQISLGTAQVYGKTTAPAAPPSGCASTITPQNIPAITPGRTCAPATPPSLGGGCGVGQVCARKAPSGLNLCVEKSGANVCPTTYSSRRSAGGATLADGGVPDGGATMDGRECRGCSCSSPTCSATATLFENADCSGGTTGALPAACTQTTNKNFTARAYRSTASQGGCQPSGFNSATTGTITFTDPSTICCP